MNPVSWPRLEESYGALCQIESPELLESLLFWALNYFPDKSFLTAPIIVEDGTLVRARAVGDEFWFFGQDLMDRGVLRDPQPSRKVVISEKYLGKLNQLGLLSPLRYEHVSQHVNSIDAREFWTLVQRCLVLKSSTVDKFSEMLSLSENDKKLLSQDFTCLEKKLNVRIKSASGTEFVPFEEYCALANNHPYPSGVKALLTQIGAGFADETIPNTGEMMVDEARTKYYVGGNAGFVLRYLKKHKDRVNWQHAADGMETLLPYLSGGDSSLLSSLSSRLSRDSKNILFNDLLLVRVRGRPAPLSHATFVHQCLEAGEFAKLFRPHMPVYSRSEAMFKNLDLCTFQELSLKEQTPIQILHECNLTLYGSIVEVNRIQILRLAAKGSGELEQLSKMKLILGKQCVAELWDPRDSLVQLEVSASAIPVQESVYHGWVPRQLRHYMRSTARLADLLAFFDGLQGSIPHEKMSKYEPAFWSRLEKLTKEEVEEFKKRHGNTAIVPIGGRLHAPAKLCCKKHLPLVGLTQAPLLQTDFKGSSLEALFDGEPEVSFVVEQLIAVCIHFAEALSATEKLSLLLPVYEFLAKKVKAGKSGDKAYIATLRYEKCVFGEAGRIDFPYHVSAAQLVDKPPRYCIHSKLRRESLKVFWREIGVHQLDDLKDLPTPFQATKLATILMDDDAERDLLLACCTDNVKVHKLLWVFACPLSKSLILPRPDEHATYELKLPHDVKFEKDVVDIIVRYVYTGRVSDENLTVHQAIRALELAGALNIEYVKEYLSQFLEGAPVAREEHTRQSQSVSVPAYWKHKVGFHRVRTNFVREALQNFMVESSVCCNTTKKAQVVTVERIENEPLWQMYQEKREYLRKMLPTHKFRELSTATAWQPALETKDMSKDINEFYLFHGTSLAMARTIAEHGFDHRVAQMGGLYGAGSYFASNACKSHQYAASHKDAAEFVMLVCRVTMGSPFCTDRHHNNERRPPDNPKTPGRPYDSIFAGTRKGNGGQQLHNEYVVFDDYQALPEFIVRYTL
jgi:hypothetical protein